MRARVPIIGGNWKMNTTRASAAALARAVASLARAVPGVEIVVYPPFPYLSIVAEILAGSPASTGAQNICDKPDGAYTGEVSAKMLLDCGCRWVLVGHSERRHLFGEVNDLVNRKVLAALAAGLDVTLCVGETRAQREAASTDAVNAAQLRAGLSQVPAADLPRIVIAYEPVWAIGTGLNAAPADAQAAHAAIRAVLASLFTDALARTVRIQYGGSVKPSNAADLFASPDVDGGLIGGASLSAEEFAAIVHATVPRP